MAILTTAPPDFAAPLALMDAAAPIIVLRLDVVSVAILAHLLRNVKLALPRLELPDLLLHLFTLDNHVLIRPLERQF